MSIEEIFAQLAKNKWHLERLLGSYGAAQGAAIFSKRSNGDLDYQETVQVINSEASTRYNASRQYIYQQDGDKIRQYFSDNRLFCVLSKTDDNVWQGEHQCGNDHYKAIYNFYNQDRFTINYEVVGPQKNYLIKTEYRKLFSPPKSYP